MSRIIIGHRIRWTLIIAIAILALVATFGATGASASQSSSSGVSPEYYEQEKGKQVGLKVGNATTECLQLGYTYGVKVDSPSSASGVEIGDGMSIDFAFTGKKVLTWSSNLGVSAVLLKAGPGFNVYDYEPAESTGDSGLVTPDSKGISHVTFCWDRELMLFPADPELVSDDPAEGTYTVKHTWTVEKTATPGVIDEGEDAVFSIALTTEAGAPEGHIGGGYMVAVNPWTIDATGVVLSADAGVELTDNPIAQTIAASSTQVYEYEFTGDRADVTITVSAAGFGTTTVTTVVNWTQLDIDGQVTIEDVFDGGDAEVVGSFGYSDALETITVVISGLAHGTYVNVANLVGDDGAVIASDDADIEVREVVVEDDDTPTTNLPDSIVGVVPGGPDAECTAVLGAGGYSSAAKVDGPGSNGYLEHLTYEFSSTEYGSNGLNTLSWSISEGSSVTAVLLKAGTGIHVYLYDSTTTSDSGLLTFEGKDISHLTICY